MDENKPLEAYSKEELLATLLSKNEIESYPLLKLLYKENARSNKYYSYFDDFLQMIYSKSSFMRMRGFGLCSSLAKWDVEKKIDKHLDELLVLLEDEKPTTVRIALSCIGDILEYKPYLASMLQKNIGRIDCSKYKDTMAPLIQKDIVKINKLIDSMKKQKLTIRPEEHKDYKSIVSLIIRSFQAGTDYSDGTDIIALVEEIRDSKYYIPELSFVAELDNKVVGHFMFSHFPLSPTREGEHDNSPTSEIVMLAPVSVHADYFRQGIGSTMIKMGIEKVKEKGYKGITVEGNFNFYNKVGFKTSSEFGIFPTSGWPINDPRCMMCMETYEGSLSGIHGFIVYDMYFNA